MENANDTDIIINGYVYKEELYALIDMQMKHYGITYDDYPVKSIDLIDRFIPTMDIVIQDFDSTNICGILYKGEKRSRICLNSKRDPKGKNFDCMHELIHYWFHPPSHRWCIYDKYIPQNKGLEWQANEGAAQALMPKKLFVKKYFELDGDIKRLSDFFFVGESAVAYRVRNLTPDIASERKVHKPKKTKDQLMEEYFAIATRKIEDHPSENSLQLFLKFHS